MFRLLFGAIAALFFFAGKNRKGSGARPGVKPMSNEDLNGLPFANHPRVISQNLYPLAQALAEKMGMRARDIIVTFAHESGYGKKAKEGGFSQLAESNSGCNGLWQVCGGRRKELGITKQQVFDMTPEESVHWFGKYIELIMKERRLSKAPDNLDDLYLAVFAPAAIGKSDSFAVYVKGTKAYAANPGADIIKDGKITRGEIITKIRATERAGLKPPYVG
jgi:hypothetical protein